MRRLLVLAGLLAIGGLAVPPAFAAPLPPLGSDRTSEDYSDLPEPDRQPTGLDAIKFIPLNDDGSSFLSLGGELRERAEVFDDADFGLTSSSEAGFLLHRALVHADLHVGQAVRIFAQLGAHEAVGKQRLAPPDEDHLDLQQLFVELVPAEAVRLRLGRQDLAFNPPARFVSFRDGANIRQAFDGLRATWRRPGWRVDGFLTRPVANARGVFDDRSNDEQMFGGLYAVAQLRNKQPIAIDAYWFLLDREGLGAGPERGKERRHSVGIRFSGIDGRLDWDAEGMIQFGTSLDREIAAWAGSVDIGFTLALPARPRLGLRFDGGSGDAESADRRIGSFYPLFPKVGYLNEAGVTSWTNLLSLRPSLSIAPLAGATVEAAMQLKWRHRLGDAVYLAPTTPLVATLGNDARAIGSAFILDANYQASRHLGLRLYYLHHAAGAAITAAGGRALDFGMAAATFRF